MTLDEKVLARLPILSSTGSARVPITEIAEITFRKDVAKVGESRASYLYHGVYYVLGRTDPVYTPEIFVRSELESLDDNQFPSVAYLGPGERIFAYNILAYRVLRPQAE